MEYDLVSIITGHDVATTLVPHSHPTPTSAGELQLPKRKCCPHCDTDVLDVSCTNEGLRWCSDE